MPLLNYTTEVPVSRTIGQVTGLLVEAGARAVATHYDDVGRPIGLVFQVETASGRRSFTLPCDAERVLAVLARDPKVERRYKTPEQAERVAWRIVKDWIEAQLAIIRTEMVTLDQVMLPYMLLDTEGRTVYELYRDEALALPPGENLG